jgi:cellulose synthase/poly-beta-1,6-N-acetylglucosamine synthase-like glycosyltransferase
LYAEATLHGPLQAGYTNGWAPLCIGSHYAVRTKALKEIGGLGPELAEDHSTSLLFNVHGWRGTHALDAIAHGDGPQTFADAMTQEFQWARSLIVLLLTVTPKVLHKLPFRLQFQFLFAQLWYPSFALLMASSMAIPVYAIISGAPIVNVPYYQFFLVFSLPTITALLIVYWLKKQQLLRPTHAKVISWEVLFFQFARWPWVLWAVISALLSTLTKKHVEFRVTPKGQKVSKWVPLRVLFPYTFLVIAPALFALLYRGSISSQGYYFFIILNSITYLFLIASVMYQQYQAYEYEV